MLGQAKGRAWCPGKAGLTSVQWMEAQPTVGVPAGSSQPLPMGGGDLGDRRVLQGALNPW